MSDEGSRAWRFYLDDMIGFAEKVVAYAKGFDQLFPSSLKKGPAPGRVPSIPAQTGLVRRRGNSYSYE